MSHVEKITHGCVVQTFDIETKECVRQEFIAGNVEICFNGWSMVRFIGEFGNFLRSLSHPFDMVQPGE